MADPQHTGSDRTDGSPVRSLVQHALDHSMIEPVEGGPAAAQSPSSRAAARLSRGTSRIATRIWTFVWADDLPLGERVNHWVGSLVGGGIGAELFLHETYLMAAGTLGGWLLAAFYYGGPHGLSAVQADLLPPDWHPPLALPLAPDDRGAPAHSQLPAAHPASFPPSQPASAPARLARWGEQPAPAPRAGLVWNEPPHAPGAGPVATPLAASVWSPPPEPAAPGHAPSPRGYVFTPQQDGRTVVTPFDQASMPSAADRAELQEVTRLEAAEEQLRKALSAAKVQITFTELAGAFTRYGQQWTVSLSGGMTIEDVTSRLPKIEAAWKVPQSGAVYAKPAPGGTKNQVLLDRLDTDPLVRPRASQRIPYGSVSFARDPAPLGFGADGVPDVLTMLRRHIGLIGANRSGKSTLLHNLLMFLTACPDVVYWLIDLQGAALPPWSRTAGRYAWDPAGAVRLLEAALALGQVRARRLGILGEQFVDSEDDELQVNHEPTAADPALVVVIDEASLLALRAPESVNLIVEIGNTLAKAGVTLLYGNQRDDQRTTGSAAIRKAMLEKIAMRCESQDDVDRFLGEELRAAGWLAHLIKQQGEYYHFSEIEGDKSNPLRARTTQLHPADLKASIREADGRRPRFPVHLTRELPMAVQRESFDEALAAIAHLMRAAGEDRIGAEALRTRLTTRDPQLWLPDAVNRELKARSINPQSIKAGDGSDSNMSGYYLRQFDNTLQDA